MSKTRRKRARSPSPRAIATGWPVLRTGIVMALLATAGIALAWHRLLPLVVQQPQYLVDADDIQITPPPRWIGRDIRREVLEDPRLARPLSILDDDLVERLATAFEFHPWVEKVDRVVKQFGPRIRVDLVYRRPVLIVQVDEGPDRDEMPVDRRGVRLPDLRLPTAELAAFPRTSSHAVVPLVGERWNDPDVLAAAAIAHALGERVPTLQVARIGLAPLKPRRTGQREAVYDLVLRDGTRIRWGHGPADGQVPAERKIERLQQWIKHPGPGGAAPGDLLLDLSPLEE